MISEKQSSSVLTAASPPPLMVTNSTLRIVLQSMREISGRQYGLLLRMAELEQFLDTLPPDDQPPQ